MKTTSIILNVLYSKKCFGQVRLEPTTGELKVAYNSLVSKPAYIS